MERYDLVVCGGGTSGVAAAYIAAKNGLKTIVVEKNIHLGGSITSGLVIPVMKSNSQNVNCEFYNDFVSYMKNYNAQITYSDGNTGWFNPEISKIVLDKMLQDVGCNILFDCEIKNANFKKNHVYSIELQSKMLSLHIESLYFLDTTGDGNFSVILKNKILKNNESRQPMTLRFHVSGVDLNLFSKWIMELDKDRNITTSTIIDGEIHLSTAYTWDTDKNWALAPMFQKAIDENDLKLNDTAYFQLFTIPGMKDTVSLNCPRILLDKDVDPLNMVCAHLHRG